jgi:VanZ family protein
MPLSSASTSILGRSVSSLADPNSWTSIALINAAQALGALVVVPLFGLPYGEVALPILLLILGATVGIVFRSFDRKKPLGLWQWWIPVIIYALFIFSLSTRSYPDASPAFNTKLFHPIEYLTLAIFLSVAWHPLIKNKRTFCFILCVQISGTLYAVSDELHQSFIPGRTATVSDVLIDSFGLALGCGIFLLARHAWGLITGTQKQSGKSHKQTYRSSDHPGNLTTETSPPPHCQ